MIYRYFFPVVLFLSFTACQKKKPVQEAAPIVSCTVNGQPWSEYVPWSLNGPYPTYAEYMDSTFFLNACRTNESETVLQRIIICSEGITQPGTYPMYTGDGTFEGFMDWKVGSPCGVYRHDTLHPGELVITLLDTVNRHIKGTFNMVLVNEDCTSSPHLTITDGQFNVHY